MQDGIENAGWQRKCRMAKNYSVLRKSSMEDGEKKEQTCGVQDD